jgi:hypothetical protein
VPLAATLVTGGGGSIGGPFGLHYTALLPCTAAILPVAVLAQLLPWEASSILSARRACKRAVDLGAPNTWAGHGWLANAAPNTSAHRIWSEQVHEWDHR